MNLRSLHERELISAIRKEFSHGQRGLVVGIGDDAAVIKSAPGFLLLTMDLLVEDVHFIASLHPPYYLGRKALSVNLSDIAAMGGRPRFALLSLALRPGTKRRDLERFLEGFKSVAEESGTGLIGGDVSASAKMTVSVTVMGEARRPILRSGARPGDHILVSGYLGDAAAGLKLLKKGYKLGKNRRADALLRVFLDPAPRINLGLALSRLRAATAMIDTSDGLSVDLFHLCQESHTGADVYLEKLPLSPGLRFFEKKPESLALHGGEDYQLLFTVGPDNLDAIAPLQKRHDLHVIGKMRRGKGISLIDGKGRRRALAPGGFEHLSGR
jgi:thiamine-monophosphate kinase